MARHPDTDLVPYLRGELPPAERERVARHLEECPDCKQDTELLRDLLGNLSHAIGQPPAVSWARYRAELREKLEARRAQVRWWRRPCRWRSRRVSPPRSCSSRSGADASSRRVRIPSARTKRSSAASSACCRSFGPSSDSISSKISRSSAISTASPRNAKASGAPHSR